MAGLSKYVFLRYSPRVTWHYPIYNRLNKTTSLVLKNRWNGIRGTELSELSLAVATKLVLLQTAVDRFNSDYAKLLDKAKQDRERIEGHVATTVWDVPDSDKLAFELIAGIEAFIFEARSTYEILGKFLTKFFRVLFEKRITEDTLKEILLNEGLDVEWARLLQNERKLFFHDTAPWLALAIGDSGNPPYELIVVKRNVATLANPDDYARLTEYGEIYNGLAKALDRLQKYTIREIDRFEKRSSPAI